MFILIAFPIADLRSFVSNNTHKLKKPTVPAAVGEHFIRSTGQAQVRLRGGSRVIGGEDLFCEAQGACRLPSDSSWKIIRLGSSRYNVKCIFRRFYRTGVSTSRFEIGFVVMSNKFSAKRDIDLDSILKKVLKIPVKIGNISGTLNQIPLIDASDALADHFRLTSTQLFRKKTYKGKRWWCSAGDPLVMVELRNDEHAILSRYIVSVDPSVKNGVRLAYATRKKMRSLNRNLGCWVLCFAENVDLRLARQLRIHLVRVHGEVQCLKRVVQLQT
ncbi:MAG: hypothetical protein D3916_14575 [Candidatus Electrothrix sp. MAN1_4]|nr:hypothetical protein [Candidatus Electrothrix sp. MAN1_4]